MLCFLFGIRSILDPQQFERNDYRDTFLSAEHLVSSFPNAKNIVFISPKDESTVVKEEGVLAVQSAIAWNRLPPPPYRLEILRSAPAEERSPQTSPSASKGSTKRKKNPSVEDVTLNRAATEAPLHLTDTIERIVVRAYLPTSAGPYPEDDPPRNRVPFTPLQVEAIRSGMNPGLSLLIGPPGTGKSDTCVQIIANLYHNFPTQKILLVTHSNAALNDLFEKIVERDVSPRHLLRLGSGELELRESLSRGGAGDTGRGQGEVFSKHGRVNWSLSRRLQLLAQVHRLNTSLGIPGDHATTCETAGFFYLQYIQGMMDRYYAQLRAFQDNSTGASIEHFFPFLNYFTDTPAPLFTGDTEHDIASAEGCLSHIRNLFTELADYRAFELLRTQSLRSDYLLTKQVRELNDSFGRKWKR